jgi:hypothetical protein
MSTVPPAEVVVPALLLDELLEQPAAARAAAATTATPHVLAFKFNVLSLSTFSPAGEHSWPFLDGR